MVTLVCLLRTTQPPMPHEERYSTGIRRRTPVPPLAQDATGDGGRTTSMRDLDGSVSGFLGATLLPRQPGVTLGYYSTPGCVAHPAFGMACPHKYVNLEVGMWDWAAGGAPAALTAARTNLSPGNAGAAGLAAQRLQLAGSGLIPKAGRAGKYYNLLAAAGAGYLLSWGGSGAALGSRLACRRAKRFTVTLCGWVSRECVACKQPHRLHISASSPDRRRHACQGVCPVLRLRRRRRGRGCGVLPSRNSAANRGCDAWGCRVHCSQPGGGVRAGARIRHAG